MHCRKIRKKKLPTNQSFQFDTETTFAFVFIFPSLSINKYIGFPRATFDDAEIQPRHPQPEPRIGNSRFRRALASFTANLIPTRIRYYTNRGGGDKGRKKEETGDPRVLRAGKLRRMRPVRSLSLSFVLVVADIVSRLRGSSPRRRPIKRCISRVYAAGYEPVTEYRILSMSPRRDAHEDICMHAFLFAGAPYTPATCSEKYKGNVTL